jgi:hypothetical protein
MVHIHKTFMQLGFNLSNRVTDKLESSIILIYWFKSKVIYKRLALIRTDSMKYKGSIIDKLNWKGA